MSLTNPRVVSRKLAASPLVLSGFNDIEYVNSKVYILILKSEIADGGPVFVVEKWGAYRTPPKNTNFL